MMKKAILFGVVLLISSEVMAMTSGFSNYIPSWSSLSSMGRDASMIAALVVAADFVNARFKQYQVSRYKYYKDKIDQIVLSTETLDSLQALQREILDDRMLAEDGRRSLNRLLIGLIQKKEELENREEIVIYPDDDYYIYNAARERIEEIFRNNGYFPERLHLLKEKVKALPLSNDRKNELYKFIDQWPAR